MAQNLDDLKKELAAQYPGWRIWRAEHGAGDLLATRKASITDAEVERGLARTLPVGLINVDLAAQLAEQTRIEKTLHNPSS